MNSREKDSSSNQITRLLNRSGNVGTSFWKQSGRNCSNLLVLNSSSEQEKNIITIDISSDDESKSMDASCPKSNTVVSEETGEELLDQVLQVMPDISKQRDFDEISDSPLLVDDASAENWEKISDGSFDDFIQERGDGDCDNEGNCSDLEILDEGVSEESEFYISYRSSTPKYLQYKPSGFFKPKIFQLSEERISVSCTNVDETKPVSENDQQEETELKKTFEPAHESTGRSPVSDQRQKNLSSSSSDKNIQSKENMILEDGCVSAKNNKEFFQGKINLLTEIHKQEESVVGLEYIVEVWEELWSKLFHYICVLCEKTFDSCVAAVEHLTSDSHRITYLVKHYPSESSAFKDPSHKKILNCELRKLLNSVCKEINDRFQVEPLSYISTKSFVDAHENELGKLVRGTLPSYNYSKVLTSSSSSHDSVERTVNVKDTIEPENCFYGADEVLHFPNSVCENKSERKSFLPPAVKNNVNVQESRSLRKSKTSRESQQHYSSKEKTDNQATSVAKIVVESCKLNEQKNSSKRLSSTLKSHSSENSEFVHLNASGSKSNIGNTYDLNHVHQKMRNDAKECFKSRIKNDSFKSHLNSEKTHLKSNERHVKSRTHGSKHLKKAFGASEEGHWCTLTRKNHSVWNQGGEKYNVDTRERIIFDGNIHKEKPAEKHLCTSARKLLSSASDDDDSSSFRIMCKTPVHTPFNESLEVSSHVCGSKKNSKQPHYEYNLERGKVKTLSRISSIASREEYFLNCKTKIFNQKAHLRSSKSLKRKLQMSYQTSGPSDFMSSANRRVKRKKSPVFLERQVTPTVNSKKCRSTRSRKTSRSHSRTPKKSNADRQSGNPSRHSYSPKRQVRYLSAASKERKSRKDSIPQKQISRSRSRPRKFSPDSVSKHHISSKTSVSRRCFYNEGRNSRKDSKSHSSSSSRSSLQRHRRRFSRSYSKSPSKVFRCSRSPHRTSRSTSKSPFRFSRSISKSPRRSPHLSEHYPKSVSYRKSISPFMTRLQPKCNSFQGLERSMHDGLDGRLSNITNRGNQYQQQQFSNVSVSSDSMLWGSSHAENKDVVMENSKQYCESTGIASVNFGNFSMPYVSPPQISVMPAAQPSSSSMVWPHQSANVHCNIQNNVVPEMSQSKEFVSAPADVQGKMFEDMRSVVKKLFGKSVEGFSSELKTTSFSVFDNQVHSDGENEASPFRNDFSSVWSTALKSSFSVENSSVSTCAGGNVPEISPNAKVQFRHYPVVKSAVNIFPIVRNQNDESQNNEPLVFGGARETSHDNFQKLSLAQLLASVLVKFRMVDVPGSLLSEMLVKIGAFNDSLPLHDISEAQVVSVLQAHGYLNRF